VLGIRKFKGVAIDLWCGAPNEFAVDRSYSDFSVTSDSLFLLGENLRHISIVVEHNDTDRFRKSLLRLKAMLDERKGSPIAMKRVTFITSSITNYPLFQNELFSVFEEDGNENP